MPKPEILVVAKLWPRYMEALQKAFVVHDRTHLQDAEQFAGVGGLTARVVKHAGGQP